MTGSRHPENGSVQPATPDPHKEDWLISVNDECQHNSIYWKALIKKGKQPDSLFQDYYTHYFYYYAHYFSWLTRIAVAVRTSYTLRIYVFWLCVLQQAYWTSGKLQLPSEAPKLFRFCAIILHYITIIAIIFTIICIITKHKVVIGVGIQCR